jgi:hypothetical protein
MLLNKHLLFVSVFFITKKGVRIMLSNKYQTGNTVRLECQFEVEEEDGTRKKVNPDLVTITFMNYKYEVIENVNVPPINTKEVGSWFYDFTLPLVEGRIIYEWKAMLQNQSFTKKHSMYVSFL